MHGVAILRGVEANIMNFNGEIDIDDDVQQQMDIVLGSLHEPVITPATEVMHTDAVIKAMASGKIDIFAHGGNPAFPIDVDEVAKAASYYKVLVEINNSSFTTSRAGSEKSCAALAEAVARHDGNLTFGSDAHIASKVGVFDKCTALVESIGFPTERILNRSGKSFLDFLKRNNKQVDLSGMELLFVE